MALKENPKTVDLTDVQGMITRGYARYYSTAYLLLEITDPIAAKRWLYESLPLVDNADHTQVEEKIIHIAFAMEGLRKWGLHEDNLATFPFAFREGMNTANRNRVLGDVKENSPENWRWGSDNKEEVLLIIHARDRQVLDAFIEEEKKRIEAHGAFALRKIIHGYRRADNTEPFGFRDGISQPVIKGTGVKSPENDLIETGEFLLGYTNEHGDYPDSPHLKAGQGDLSLLSDMSQQKGVKDLGKNGSFMVFRQMEQKVDAFWKAMERHTLKPDGTVDEAAKIRLASKCVGRWPSGAALVQYPDYDPGEGHTNDSFGYSEEDPNGLRCPFGSHLRRNNPRDQMRWYNKEQSLKITRRHRIIRRGRIYDEVLPDGSTETGLLFVCFNANIELQFEFIQHVWSNNNQMPHLSNDVDILIGVGDPIDPASKVKSFTVQNDPVSEYYDGWEQFVNIRGGSYFFFPSLSALNFLTTV